MRRDVKHLLILLADGQQSNIGLLNPRPNGEVIPNLNETAQALKMKGMYVKILFQPIHDVRTTTLNRR